MTTTGHPLQQSHLSMDGCHSWIPCQLTGSPPVPHPHLPALARTQGQPFPLVYEAAEAVTRGHRRKQARLHAQHTVGRESCIVTIKF